MRNIYEIAREIENDWKNVWYGARPHLDAMHTMDTLENGYLYPGRHAGESVVIGFLGNAQTWRGETARRVKKELKGMVGL